MLDAPREDPATTVVPVASSPSSKRPAVDGRVRPAAADPRGHFPPLDGLRGVALLMIVCHHVLQIPEDGSRIHRTFQAVFGAGWLGVNLFFVLSGFLIGGILIDSRGTRGYFKSFYARRSIRIFPVYYLFLIAYFGLIVPATTAGSGPGTVDAKWAYFGYVANFFPPPGGDPTYTPLNPLWSLSVEEQVYLVWPAIVAFCPPRHLPALLMAIVPASLAWRLGVLLLHLPILIAYSWTPACLDGFAAGTLAAWIVRGDWSRSTLRDRAGMVAIGSGTFLLGIWLGQGHFNFWISQKYTLTLGLTASTALFSAIMIYLVSDDLGSTINRLFSWSILRKLGKYSYAMYLFHETINSSFLQGLPPRFIDSAGFRSIPGQVGFLVVILCCSYLAAMASWYLVEVHFLRLKRYFPSAGRGVPTRGEVSVASQAGRSATDRQDSPAASEDAGGRGRV